MKRKAYLSFVVVLASVCAFGLVNISCKGSHGKQDMSDSLSLEDSASDSSSEEVPIPDFLKNIKGSSGSEGWWTKVICKANDKTYYYAADDLCYRTNVIYTIDGILCEDPTLDFDSVDSKLKTTFRVTTPYKTVIVDFANEKSIEQLKTFNPKFANFTRFSEGYSPDYAERCQMFVRYYLEMDMPDDKSTTSKNLCAWLSERVTRTVDREPYCIEGTTRLQNGFTKNKYKRWKYKGDKSDFYGICKYVSDKYFIYTQFEHGEPQDDSFFPSSLFMDFSLRLVSTNGKYYSYQERKFEYNGGAHGHYTECLESFDPSSKQLIDWDYLFMPGHEEEIFQLLCREFQKNRKLMVWEHITDNEMIMAKLERSNFSIYLGHKEHEMGDISFPNPGLSDDGVVFSYQPGELSVEGLGAFHLTIPYKDLEPFLTDRAKDLLNL